MGNGDHSRKEAVSCYNRGMSEDKLMTTSEVAKLLKMGTQRVRDLIDEGRFPGARQYGRDWMIPEKSVLAFERKKRGPKKKS